MISPRATMWKATPSTSIIYLPVQLLDDPSNGSAAYRGSLAKQSDPSLRCRSTHSFTDSQTHRLILSLKGTLCGMKSVDHRTIPDNSNSKAPQPRFAICTALPKELAACRLILDDPAPVNSGSANDSNQYWCAILPSRAGGMPHQVVLTLWPKMGNNVSSAAVTNLVRSFPSVEYILMVGIAGGVPDPRSAASHVRLGDVVVSNEKGVLQYDNVKRTSDHIEIRDNSPKPGAALIAAAKALESDFDSWSPSRGKRIFNKAECLLQLPTPRARNRCAA